MILDYYRPKTIQEALDFKTKHPKSRFIGGGSSLQITEGDFRVIDLQVIGLNQIKKEKNNLSIGSMTTLEELFQYFKDIPDLTLALQIEGSKNTRNRATIGGLLMSADGRSPFLTCLVSLNPRIVIEPNGISISITDFLKQRNHFDGLITGIELEIPTSFIFESIGRSPLDKPIVCCAVSNKDSAKSVGVGGFGKFPILITTSVATDIEKSDLFDEFSLEDDQWASAQYRSSLIKTLVQRLSN